MDGTSIEFVIPGVGLARAVPVHLWSPPGATSSEPLPLLIAHDGRDYFWRAQLVEFCAAGIASGDLPRHRVAMLHPEDRDLWYSGLPAYDETVVRTVLPAIYQRVATVGKPVAIGASLGALTALTAEYRHPGTFAGLFLQSGSFFRPEFDSQEDGFARFAYIVALVGEMQSAGPARFALPIRMTCGQQEENLRNNRQMRDALAAQEHSVHLDEVPGGHNFEDWGDTFATQLTALLQACWPPARYGRLAS